MRPVERIDRIQDMITRLWKEHNTDLRYFQFVVYLMNKIDENKEDFFYYEDEDLEKALKKILDEEHTYNRLKEFNDFCS